MTATKIPMKVSWSVIGKARTPCRRSWPSEGGAEVTMDGAQEVLPEPLEEGR